MRTQWQIEQSKTTHHGWLRSFVSPKRETKETQWVPASVTIWLSSWTYCKALRYPLVLRGAGMGLEVPRGPRWLPNPWSRYEKVSHDTGKPPTPILNHPLTATERLLRLAFGSFNNSLSNAPPSFFSREELRKEQTVHLARSVTDGITAKAGFNKKRLGGKRRFHQMFE